MLDFFNLGLSNEISAATFLSQDAQQSANPPNTKASFVFMRVYSWLSPVEVAA
jgi:hypothetical protein